MKAIVISFESVSERGQEDKVREKYISHCAEMSVKKERGYV